MGAIEVLIEMQRSVVSPNVISFSAAISACDRAGQWVQALALLAAALAAGLEPDVFAFSAAISACSTAGLGQAAVKLLNEMQGWELRTSTHSALHP
mmetsp:Transcript_40075/g.114658  ORF Transcript_40075/g.114658 Transcript_40075/m.114658 type:complete len:96 (+) Transcript_40075:382-669(+)